MLLVATFHNSSTSTVDFGLAIFPSNDHCSKKVDEIDIHRQTDPPLSFLECDAAKKVNASFAL